MDLSELINDDKPADIDPYESHYQSVEFLTKDSISLQLLRELKKSEQLVPRFNRASFHQ